MAKRQRSVGAEARGLLLELSETLQDKADEFRNLAGMEPQVIQSYKDPARESPQGTRYR